MDNSYKRLGKNTIWVFIGRSGNFIMSFIMLPFYTHWLSPSEYGEGDLIQTYATILMCFTSCCIAQSIFIFPKNSSFEEKKRYYSSGWFFILVSSGFSAILILLLSIIFDYLGYNFFLFEHKWLIFALVCSSIIQEYTQQFTRSIDKMSVYSITGVIQSILVAISSLILVRLYGLKGYISSIIISAVLASLYSFFASQSYTLFSFKYYDKIYLKKLLVYGIPLIPNTLMWWLVNGFNRPIIEEYLGLFAVGLFAIANRFPGIITNVSTIFTNAWGISMIEEFGKPGFSNFFNKNFRFIFIILVILSSLVSIFSKQIISLFTTDSYVEAWKILPILVLGSLFSSLSSLVGGIFMAIKNSKFFLLSSLAGGFSSIIFTSILVKFYDLQGAAWATTFSFFVILIVRFQFAWKYISKINLLYYIKMVSIMILLAIFSTMTVPLSVMIIYIFLFYTILYLLNKDFVSLLYSRFISIVKSKF